MKLSTLLLLALLPTAACSKKDNKNEAPATGAKPTTDPGTPAGATPSGTTAPSSPAKLDCDKVLSKGLREKYFKAYNIENIPSPVDFSATCQIKPVVDKLDGKPHGGEMNVQCHDNVKTAKAPSIDGLKKAFPDMKAIDGIPDSLARSTEAGWQFSAWDSDSNCNADGIVPDGVDGPAFVKDLLSSLPPA